MFFFNDTATTEIYTLSLHDALPIFVRVLGVLQEVADHGDAGRPALDLEAFPQRELVLLRRLPVGRRRPVAADVDEDRKSTRLNSSHANISYAVFCLKKKHPATDRGR